MIIYNGKVFGLVDNIKFIKAGKRKKRVRYYVFDDKRVFPIKGSAAKLFEAIIHYDLFRIEDTIPKKTILKHFDSFLESKWIKEINGTKDKTLSLSCFAFLTVVNGKYYIINFLYRTIDRISKETYDLIIKNQLDKIPSSELFYLYVRRYIREKCDSDELDIFENYVNSKLVYLIFSYDCNMRCTYCYERNKDRNSQISNETLENSIKFIDSLSLGNNVVINFYGGEPLLNNNRDKLFSVINHFKKNYNVYYRFISNGMNVKEYIDLFDSVKDKIIGFVITLDGTKYIHDKRRITNNLNGSFDNVIESICFLNEHDFNVTIRINIDNENLACQEELIKYLNKNIKKKKNVTLEYHRVENKTDPSYDPIEYRECYKLYKKAKKISRYNVVFNLPIINTLESLNKNFYPKIKDAYCMVNSNYVIDFDGNIYSCNEAMGINDFKVGSVENSDQNVVRNREENDHCRTCYFYTACYGGCHLENYYARMNNVKKCYKKQIEDTVREYISINQNKISF